MGILHTYDPMNYLVTVNGTPIIGWADDEKISIEWETDWWTDKVGLDREVTRSAQNDFRANVNLKLMRTSASNAWLNLQLVADTVGVPKTNASTFTFAMTSLLPGGDNFIGLFSWIKKPPSYAISREANVLDWPLRCPELFPAILGK